MNQNGENYREPYRATKLWLEAVAIFRNGVPLGKNRLKFKSHENSFEAAGAITWFHAELQKRFDEGITRKQALALLQKFYKVGIFVHVNSTRVQNENGSSSPQLASLVTSNSLDGLKESDFKDNGQIYRLASLRDNHEVNEGEKKKEPEEKNETQKVASYTESIGKGSGASTGNFYVIVKLVEMEMIYRIWEQVFIQRFSRIVGCDVLTSFYGPGIIRGEFIAHNLTQNGKNGIVLTSAENEDMPPWLFSAMKCLASWPNHHSNDPGMPNYPNFESDVFKLVTDYFGVFKGGEPLLTYKLYSAFITCFIRAELFDFNARLYSLNTSKTMNASLQLKNRLGDEYPFTASESVENLILDILTPAKSSRKHMNSAYRPKRIFENEKPKEVLRPVVEGKEGKSVLSPMIDPVSIRPMTPQDYTVDRYKNPFFYETAFTGEGSPITRVVSATELKTSMSSLARRPLSLTNSSVLLPKSSFRSVGTSGLPDASYNSEFFSDMTMNPNGRDEQYLVGIPSVSITNVTLSRPNSTIGLRCPSRTSHLIESNVDGSPYQPFVYENPNLELSASDIINHPKYTNLDLGEMESSYSFCEYSGETSGSGGSGYGSGTSSYLDVEGVTRSASALQLSDGIKDRSPYAPPMKYPGNGNTPQPSSTSWFGFDGNNGKTTKTPVNVKSETKSSFGLSMFGKVTKGLKHHYARDSPSKTVRRTLDFYYGADACVPGLMTAEGKMLAIQSFRLLTLLIPPSNRRHLQYLLRCMNKMSKNEKLKLDVLMTTRAIVINAFFRSVLSSEEIEEFDELLALRIATFLMDNDTEIFSTKDEKTEMSAEVQDLTAKEQITKVPITPKKENKENEGDFCAKISLSEYEEQRLLGGTAQSLRDLLDAISHDEKMEEKLKRKRLKQFREEYPHIYFEKFGDEHDFLASGASIVEKKSAFRRFLRI